MTIKAFEVSFTDPSLFVRARISDVSTGTAVFVANVVMAEDSVGTYYGTYDFDLTKPYLVQPRVYTDGTYGTVDSAYSAASTTINPAPSGGSSSSGSSGCGLIVTLVESGLFVTLADDLLDVALSSDVLSPGISEDSLTIIFPCND